MGTLDNIISITAALTTDSELCGDEKEFKPQELIDYLNESPRHALAITGFEEESDECEIKNAVYVLCGASDQPDNYYYGLLPAEDPNDAEGGDLTAKEAISLALDLMTVPFDEEG